MHPPTNPKHKKDLVYYGLSWTKESCWVDSTLMSLFFPDDMFTYFAPFVERYTENMELRQLLKTIIQNIRTPVETNPKHTIRNLRSILRSEVKGNLQRDRAFRPENEYGYVYYFIVEFLKLLHIPPSYGRKSYIVSLRLCQHQSIQQCLQKTSSITSDINDPPYLIIETYEHETVFPSEYIKWCERIWKLQAMIVFDCSHFMTYLLKHNKWYIYDDTLSLENKPLRLRQTGEQYKKEGGMCQFNFNANNTFLFYIEEPKEVDS